MAAMALDSGYTEQNVREATIGHFWSWNGSESEMWERRRTAFEEVMGDSDSRISRIGHEGVEEMNKRKQAAMRREETMAVEGHAVARRRRRR
jgi:hypothetical protein